MDRTERFYKIELLLRGRGCVSFADLQDELDISPATLKRDFKSFFMALLPRVMEGGRLYDAHTARWAIEDAWRAPLVQQRWAQFARQLDADQCEVLRVKAAARRLTTRTVMPTTDAGATDGWNLATRGYVPHAPTGVQRELAW
ncbi:MAG: hypothetical protein ABUL50_05765 [Rhizobacter sp.]